MLPDAAYRGDIKGGDHGAATDRLGSFLRRLVDVAVRRPTMLVALAFQAIRCAPVLLWFATRPRESMARRFVAARPALRGMILTPLISARWGAGKRFAVIKRHFTVAERIGGLFMVAPDAFVEVLNLSGIAPALNVTIDSPAWLLREGLLALSLWDAGRRIYTLSFTLGREDGRLILFIGGLQGVRLDDGGQLYRQLTKAAHGLRPRDLLIEVMRSVARVAGVEQLLAVADDSRHHHSRYSRTWIRRDPVANDYDDIWRDRGGTLRADGFFDLPLEARRRDAAEIAPKKRSMYAARYRMLDAIDAGVRDAVAAPSAFRTHPHRGDLSRGDALAAAPPAIA